MSESGVLALDKMSGHSCIGGNVNCTHLVACGCMSLLAVLCRLWLPVHNMIALAHDMASLNMREAFLKVHDLPYSDHRCNNGDNLVLQ